jgi:hypothetical protein
VEYSTNDGSTWTSASSAFHTSTATQQKLVGLANGTSYLFRVSAINGQGTGSYSASGASTTNALVSFGAGHPATSVTYVSATKLTAVPPLHSATAGYVNVTVTTAGGTSATVTADHYAYS